jgi:hypothetical protein
MIHMCPDLFIIRPGVDPQDESLLTLHLTPPPSTPRPGKAVLKSSSEDEETVRGAGEAKQPAGKAGATMTCGEAAAAAAAAAAVVPRKRHRSTSDNKDLRQVSFK